MGSIENSGQIRAVADRKTVALRLETFTQVLILRILGVRGEVAEYQLHHLPRAETRTFATTHDFYLHCESL